MLDAAALHEPNPAVLEFRKLLRAEVLRSQVVREGREPNYQGDDATPAQKAAMRARMLLRLGDVARSIEAAAEIETLRPRAPGRIENADGTSVTFDDLRDADDLLAAEIEMLTTGGDYMLVPVERVRSLSFDAPRRSRDLVLAAVLDRSEGRDGGGGLPAGDLHGPRRRDGTCSAAGPGDRVDGTCRRSGPRSRAAIMLVGDEAVPFTTLAKVVFD